MTSSLSIGINKKTHSSFWNAVSTVSLATTGLALVTTALGAASAGAATFTIPSTTVAGTSVDSGPSFTVTDTFTGADLISLSASGIVDLATNETNNYFTNAAGTVVTQTTFTGTPVGGFNGGPLGYNYGALLLGNSTLGFFSVFPSGSTDPLSISNVTLASLGFTSGIAAGTTLEFRVNDILSGLNNAGSYTVSGSLESTAVPEPFTVIGTIIGGTAAFRLRKKLKSDRV